MKANKYPVRLCAIPFASIDYRSVLSVHATLQEALKWANLSGIKGRIWLETDAQPATLAREAPHV